MFHMVKRSYLHMSFNISTRPRDQVSSMLNFPSNYRTLLTKSFPFKIDVTRDFYSFQGIPTYALAFCVTNHVAEKLLCSFYNAYYSTAHWTHGSHIIKLHECAKKLLGKCYRKITFPCTIANAVIRQSLTLYTTEMSNFNFSHIKPAMKMVFTWASRQPLSPGFMVAGDL